MNSKHLIALLVGGVSEERPISKLTSKGVYNSLLKLGYKVRLIDPAYGLNQPANADDFFSEKDFAEIKSENYYLTINSEYLKNVDSVFIGLHGKYGEDGIVQSFLEAAKINYIGSGILACSLALNKAASKVLFKNFGIPTPRWLLISKNVFSLNDVSNEIENKIGFPAIIKPNDQGSTIGLSLCSSKEELEKAFEICFKVSNEALIEEYIDGYEITVGILGDEVLPTLRIKPKKNIYDYECKYTAGMSEYETPANLPEELNKIIQEYGRTAHNALGCRHYSRVDFRLEKKTMKPYCLEVNPLPGMTPSSLLPKMAKASGLSFDDLVDKLIKMSLLK